MSYLRIVLFFLLTFNIYGNTFSDTIPYIEPLDPFSLGTESSGGGAAVVCMTNKNIDSVEMLDLVEGSVLFKHQFQNPRGLDYKELIDLYIGKLSFDKGFQLNIERVLDKLYQRTDFLPENYMIHTPADLGADEAVLLPIGCQIFAVGYYEADGTLKISKSLFDRMNSIHKAAFYLHEALYYLYRNLNYELLAYGDHYKEFENDYNAKETRVFLSHLINEKNINYDLDEVSKSFRWFRDNVLDPIRGGYLLNGWKYAEDVYFSKSSASKNLLLKLKFKVHQTEESQFFVKCVGMNFKPPANAFFLLEPFEVIVKNDPKMLKISKDCIAIAIYNSKQHYLDSQKNLEVSFLMGNKVIRTLDGKEFGGGYNSQTWILVPLYEI